MGGGIQVGNALISTLKCDRHDFLVCASPELLRSLGKEFRAPDNVGIVSVPRRSTLRRLLGSFPVLDRIVKEYSPDAVFTLFGPSYWRPAVRHICGFAKSQYIYRDSPFFRGIGPWERMKLVVKRMVHMRSFRRDVDVYITESGIISEKLCRLIPGKPVYTVPNSFNPVFEDRRKQLMRRLQM